MAHRTYEKPTLVREEVLQRVVAGGISGDVIGNGNGNGNGNGSNGNGEIVEIPAN